jgi:endogenous inhibitor of DNA gyrase (YacG/DUF329 family)
MCQALLDSPVTGEFRPFCSARCKRLDLLNWLEGRYSLPRDLTPEELSELPEDEREALLGSLLKRATPGDPN